MSHENSGYASDLSDKEWELIQPLLPLKREGPGRPLDLDIRQAVNAIFYVVRTGCPWEYMPKEYPNYNSVYYHYRKRCRDGTWQRVNTALRQMDRQ